ncbi:MAG TPA: cytochrome c peroxidase [Blastocatellia bacterium]|nr:cytochrome c peroxidase [Blastocatellia bacterium]
MGPRTRSNIPSRLAVIAIVVVAGVVALGQGKSRSEGSARVDLGLRLFKDARFSSPQGDLQNSCSSCHLQDEDPQGMRAQTDFFARSWVPFRSGDPRRDELRNSPTILDAALMPRLHFDGEFDSLESLVKGTLAGRPMGWLPAEKDQAFDHIRRVILKDSGEGARSSYRAQFTAAFQTDPEKLSSSQLIDQAAQAISDYMRTLRTRRTTAYDRFVSANGLEAAPAPGEDAKVFADRQLNRLETLESKRALKLPAGFDATALRGMRIFLETRGSSSVGNCVACHAPPLFTDLSFHNMGISQVEYDQLNGDGSFAALDIPGPAEARRPSLQFRETPTRKKPGFVDLGHWNFVDLKTSGLRRAGESDDRFLGRMIATFKTPTLRNLAFSQPYMHTGGFTTLESALGELMRLSEMARAKKVREGDEELARIRITESDIDSLVAFLNTLNENFTGRKD